VTQPTSTLEGNVAIVKHIKLRELDVSRIGLGAMGMSHGYTGAGSDDAESIRTIHRALELGVTSSTPPRSTGRTRTTTGLVDHGGARSP